MSGIAAVTEILPVTRASRALTAFELPEGEPVRGMTTGVVGSDNALLVVTDRRVLLVREGDDHQSSVVLPLSELQTVQWQPAAECHHHHAGHAGHGGERPGPESGWGSVWLGGADSGVRLSLVVAGDGKRIVELIRSTIGSRPDSADGPPDLDTTEMSTAIILPELDTAVTPAGVVAPRASPDERTGRHRGTAKSQPTRHSKPRDRTVKRYWPLAAAAAGLGLVVALGLHAGDPLAAAFGGCSTHAGDPASVARALSSASPGDRICVTSDLSSFRVTITQGGDATNPVTVEGEGRTLVAGITVHADNVVVSGFQVLGDPVQAIRIRGNGINVDGNLGSAGPVTPTWG
jgi:hypothetical protein